MKKQPFSLVQLQDMFLDEKEFSREKTTVYATDFEKCPSGVYFSLIGEKPAPIDSEGLRRMQVGDYVERNQVDKLKALGIFIEAPGGEKGFQHRAFDEEHGISGRLDGLVIDPAQCSASARKIIERKKEIFQVLKKYKGNFYTGLNKFTDGEISEQKFFDGRTQLMKMEHQLYQENRKLNEDLLEPKKGNPLRIVEFKSSSEWGFNYYRKEGRPNSSHEKQLMFYVYQFRKIYPDITGNIVYVQMPWQEMMEFEVKVDETRVQKEMHEFADYIHKCVQKKKTPEPCSDVEYNEMTGKWKINFRAETCRYHHLCTGDPNWLEKAKNKVTALNLKSAKERREMSSPVTRSKSKKGLEKEIKKDLRKIIRKASKI